MIFHWWWWLIRWFFIRRSLTFIILSLFIWHWFFQIFRLRCYRLCYQSTWQQSVRRFFKSNQFQTLMKFMGQPKSIGYLWKNKIFHGEYSSQSTTAANWDMVKRSESLSFESLHKWVDINTKKKPISSANFQRVTIWKIFSLLFSLNGC